MSGGFFRGTSAEQDTRFSNKQAKLLKTQKFAPELEHLVDITKVKMDVIKPWIAKRVTELLEGFEDEVLINFIYGLLEGKDVNGKEVQIQLTGFMEKNTGKFMKELWALLLSAQKNASGVPQQFLDAKEEETRKKKAETDRIFDEIQRRKEKETKESEQEKEKQMDDGLGNNRTEESNRRRGRGSGVQSGDENGSDVKNGFRGRSRSHKSPSDHSQSPHRTALSRSISKSHSNPRSYSKDRSMSRSVSGSPGAKWRSVSPERRSRLPRRSITPRRQSVRESKSPRRRSPRRRSSSRTPCRSPSPMRRRVRSPARRSPSPIRRRSPLRRSVSPSWRQSRTPLRRRSRSPLRRRSPPRRRRSPSPWRRRSPFSGRRRSPSPVRRRRRSSSPLSRSRSAERRSPSPRRRSPSPRRRFQSPIRKSSFPVRRRSPSPGRRSPSPDGQKSQSHRRRRSPLPRGRRSPSLVENRPLSPVRQRSLVPARRRSPTPSRNRSYSPTSRSPDSPIRRISASPVKVRSPRLHNSLKGSPGEKIRNREPATTPHRQPITLSPQRDHSNKKYSRRKVPSVSPPLEKLYEARRLTSPSDSPGVKTGEKVTLNGGQSPSRSKELRGPHVSLVTSEEKLGNDREYEDNIKFGDKKSAPRASSSKLRESTDRTARYQHRDGSVSRKSDNEKRSDETSLMEAHAVRDSPCRGHLSDQRSDEVYVGGVTKVNKKGNSEPKDVGDDAPPELVSQHRKRRSPSIDSDSGSEESEQLRSKVSEKRKHRKSRRRDVASDDTSSESEIEDRKEAKRRKKEEKKLRKEERRRRREERRRKKEEKRASKRKRKSKDDDDALSSDMEKNEKGAIGELRSKKYSSDEEETESKKKMLEIELREKALESLRAKKGINR